MRGLLFVSLVAKRQGVDLPGGCDCLGTARETRRGAQA